MRELITLKCKSNDVELKDKINEKDEEFPQKSNLPHDLITHSIIIRLPIKSLLQFKSVSKQWYSTLSSPHFANSHFNFSSFNQSSPPIIHNLFVQSGIDYFIYSHNDEFNKGLFKLDIEFDELPKDKIFVIGSCNGLICLYCELGLGYLIIWNPVINQWIKLLSPPLLNSCKSCSTTWGFGYVSSIADYRVVRIIESKRQNPSKISVHVFSFRTRKWKQINDQKLDGYVLRGASLAAGLLIHERLYWIVYRQGGEYEYEYEYEQDVLAFDLALQRFNTVQNVIIRGDGDSYLGWVRFLCCMGGCLSFSRVTNRGDVSVSILKQSGEVDYIGVYRDLELGRCCGAVGFTSDGSLFVQLGERELGLVDPNCSPKRYTSLFRFSGVGFIDVKSYVPSLVSPFDVARVQE